MRYNMVVAAAGIALAACSPAPQAIAGSTQPGTNAAGAVTRHPVSGLAVIDLSVTSAGKVHPFRVEVADTSQAQARGLMFRTELGDQEGMLFPSDLPGVRSFWMKNTPLSLDIIFVGMDGRILNIAADTVPYSLDSIPSAGIASAVLELRAGRVAALGIRPGDKVEWELP